MFCLRGKKKAKENSASFFAWEDLCVAPRQRATERAGFHFARNQGRFKRIYSIDFHKYHFQYIHITAILVYWTFTAVTLLYLFHLVWLILPVMYCLPLFISSYLYVELSEHCKKKFSKSPLKGVCIVCTRFLPMHNVHGPMAALGYVGTSLLSPNVFLYSSIPLSLAKDIQGNHIAPCTYTSHTVWTPHVKDSIFQKNTSYSFMRYSCAMSYFFSKDTTAIRLLLYQRQKWQGVSGVAT